MGRLFQGEDLFVEEAHYGTVTGKGDDHYIAAVFSVGDVGVLLCGLVEDHLPPGKTAADTVYHGNKAAVVYIHQLPKIMPLRRMVKIFVKFKIVYRVEAGNVDLRHHRNKMKGHKDLLGRIC